MRYNTLGQAKFYVEHLGADFGDYLAEHDRYKRARSVAEAALQELALLTNKPTLYVANIDEATLENTDADASLQALRDHAAQRGETVVPICAALEAQIAELEPEERDVLSLVVSSDLSYRQIARITGTSEGNIKVRVHRARVKLRKMINAGEK